MAGPRGGLSLTAAATLAHLQRSGPARLTELAVAEGVSQPSMTTLVARLADQGLVRRGAGPRGGGGGGPSGRAPRRPVPESRGRAAARPTPRGPHHPPGRPPRRPLPRRRAAHRRGAARTHPPRRRAAPASDPRGGDPVSSAAGVSIFKQPKAVFAVAFACVVSFMGIGLVDPILPTLRTQLGASPSQISLLFTSSLVVTAVAMLVTGWVSSRIGAKWTLITGLLIIVVFSALAGLSGSINGIVGFRAGWGLGNALFIATSLAVIVASATGGFAGAIVLYEAALGLGIAAGPLVGGLLGNISW